MGADTVAMTEYAARQYRSDSVDVQGIVKVKVLAGAQSDSVTLRVGNVLNRTVPVLLANSKSAADKLGWKRHAVGKIQHIGFGDTNAGPLFVCAWDAGRCPRGGIDIALGKVRHRHAPAHELFEQTRL